MHKYASKRQSLRVHTGIHCFMICLSCNCDCVFFEGTNARTIPRERESLWTNLKFKLDSFDLKMPLIVVVVNPKRRRMKGKVKVFYEFTSFIHGCHWECSLFFFILFLSCIYQMWTKFNEFKISNNIKKKIRSKKTEFNFFHTNKLNHKRKMPSAYSSVLYLRKIYVIHLDTSRDRDVHHKINSDFHT